MIGIAGSESYIDRFLRHELQDGRGRGSSNHGYKGSNTNSATWRDNVNKRKRVSSQAICYEFLCPVNSGRGLCGFGRGRNVIFFYERRHTDDKWECRRHEQRYKFCWERLFFFIPSYSLIPLPDAHIGKFNYLLRCRDVKQKSMYGLVLGRGGALNISHTATHPSTYPPNNPNTPTFAPPTPPHPHIPTQTHNQTFAPSHAHLHNTLFPCRANAEQITWATDRCSALIGNPRCATP